MNLKDNDKTKTYIDEIPVKDNRGNIKVVKVKKAYTPPPKTDDISPSVSLDKNLAEPEQTKKTPVLAEDKEDKIVKKDTDIETKRGADEKAKDVALRQKISLQPPPPAVVKSSKPAFMFHPEDEEEVTKLVSPKEKEAPKLSDDMQEKNSTERVSIDDMLKKKEEIEKGVETKVKEIIEKLPGGLMEKVKETIATGEERFINLIKTRIKGARNNIALWQNLIKPANEGGLGLTDEDADMVIKVISECVKDLSMAKKELEKPVKASPPLDLAEDSKKSEEIVSLEEDKKEEIPTDKQEQDSLEKPAPVPSYKQTEQQDAEQKPESSPDNLVSLSSKDEQGKPQEDEPKEKVAEKKEAAASVFTPFGAQEEDRKINFYQANRGLDKGSNKPKIEDIKYRPKLVGPIAEIAELKIKDFRQLSPDANQAADMIKNKIDLLGEESFAKRMEGLQAWRKSEIYKIYLELGRQAILENKSIKDLVPKLQAEKKNYLTEAEFNAIMDLNKKLRF